MHLSHNLQWIADVPFPVPYHLQLLSEEHYLSKVEFEPTSPQHAVDHEKKSQCSFSPPTIANHLTTIVDKVTLARII